MATNKGWKTFFVNLDLWTWTCELHHGGRRKLGR